MAEDSDNALIGTVPRSATVYVNPLAAISSGISAAEGEYRVRGMQAKEAAGRAYQGAINPQTGEFDANRFRTLLSESGPAAMEAGAALLNTQNISSNQFEQNLKKAQWVNAKAGAVLQSGDFSDAAMLGLFQEGIANGTLTMPEVQRQMQLLPHDAAGRERWLREHQMTSATVQQQLEQSGQTRQTVTTPQGTYDYTRPPPGAGTVFTPAGAGAGETKTISVPYDAQGEIPPDANGNPSRPPQGWRPKEVHVGTVATVPQGGPPAIIPGSGHYPNLPPSARNPGAAPPPPPAATPAPAPAAPGGAPGGYTGGGFGGVLAPATPGPQSMNLPPGASPALAAIEAGRLQAATGTPASAMPMVAGPGAGPTAQPLRPVEPGWGATGGMAPAGDPAAVPPPPALGAPAPPRPAVAPRDTRTPGYTTPPQGQPAEQAASQELFIKDRTALSPRQTQEQNLTHAYEALKLVTTGKGTENASSLRNLLATVGWLPKGAVDDEAIYEIGRKYLERTIADVGNAGGTDSARALAAASNPNTGLINEANLVFLRNDLGKVRQQMAPYLTAPDKTVGRGYGDHAANIATNTDYRGFAWDLYSDPEKAEITKSVGPKGSPAHDALARAIGMGREFWPTKGPVNPVPHSQAAPPVSSSALAMLGQPQRNALSAYA